MIKLQADNRPTYVLSYPRSIRLARSAMVALLALASLLGWIMAWVRFLRPVIAGAATSAEAAQLLVAQPLRPLISAHLSLLLVVSAIAFVYDLLPDLSLVDEGLAMRAAFGWQAIPWQAITVVRMASLHKGRQLVLVQGRWSRWSPWPRLVSACLGGGFEPGLLFSSDIRDFEPLLQRLVREVSQAVPEATLDDEFYALPARLLLEPSATLEELVEQARDEGWPLNLSAQAMAAAAGGLVLCQVLILILAGGPWWKPLAILALCGLEWVIGAMYLYALTEIFPGKYEFREGALLYPLAQIPRALLALPMAMVIAAGVPFLAAMLGLAGVLWAVLLTVLLVQQMYHLKSILPAMAGAALQAIFQFIVLSIVFAG